MQWASSRLRGTAPAAAAEALESALDFDSYREAPLATAADVRKLLACYRLGLGQPALARTAIGTLDDPEARWLLARANLQEGKPCEDLPNPSRDPIARDPAPYVGAASCIPCHQTIARGQRDSHHARTFWAGSTLAKIPVPDHALVDPANPAVVHTFRRVDKVVHVETRAEGRIYRAILAYAFGSEDRGLTPVGSDESGRWCELRISRYADGPSWDVTPGHETIPTVSSDWLGKSLNEDARGIVSIATRPPREPRGRMRGHC